MTPEEKVAEMFTWRALQLRRLRAGLRGYGRSARRDDGAIPSTNRRAHLPGRSVVSLSLDGIQIGRG
jgi:hypothetical protein